MWFSYGYKCIYGYKFSYIWFSYIYIDKDWILYGIPVSVNIIPIS